MTASYLVQVQIPHDNAAVRDAAVNTFSFLGPDVPLEADRTILKTMLTSFYSTIHTPGTTALSAYLSNSLAPLNTRLKAYRRSDPIPRAPIFDEPIGFASTSSGALPHEVALVLSFRSALVSGGNAARRRGRIFFGPLAASITQPSTEDARPTAALVNALVGAGSYLMAPGIPANPWTWIVHSSLSGDSTVVAGHVDNGFDTQRRRGVRATTRTAF